MRPGIFAVAALLTSSLLVSAQRQTAPPPAPAGDEPAGTFNPTALDARQWARVARDAGMKGLIYEQSIGRGSNLLLNIPPDRRGLIPDIDAQRLREFGERIAATYKPDLARQATARVSQVRAGAAVFSAARVNDGQSNTYWATDDGVTTGTLELQWANPVRIDRLVFQEFIARGQAVESWLIEAEAEAGWAPLARGTTIGHKRIATSPPVTTKRVRLTIEKARASLAISAVGAYLAPGPG